MNNEQIILKLGVDGLGIKTGLGKAGATIKAWATEQVLEFRKQGLQMMKGFLGAEAVTRGVEKFSEFLTDVNHRILKIKKDSADTGLSTNFIQELYSVAEKSGVPFETLQKNLLHFNSLIGAAKVGSLQAREKLIQFGIAEKSTAWETLNLHDSLNKLRAMHVSTADASLRNYREEQLLGKGYKNLTPILMQTKEAFDEMDRSNFFTKINDKSINLFTGLFGAKVGAMDVARATGANILPSLITNLVGSLTQLPSLQVATAWVERILEKKGEAINIQEAALAADQQDIINLEQKNELLAKQIEMEGQIKDLKSSVADRDKLSLDEMASRYEKITGTKSPLERFQTITPRIRTAYKIRELEDKSRIAFLKGQDEQSTKFQSEADQIRRANVWMKATDVNPMERTERKLEELKLLVEPISQSAEIMRSDFRGHGAGGDY